MARIVLTVALAPAILPGPGRALNRLTFGPRPGDLEEVRRIGLAKWVELQSHPQQIPENAVLEQRLKPIA